VDLHRLLSDRAELKVQPRDHRRGGARFFLRSQCDVLDSGTVATLHQQHARLFGRHRPSRSRTRQALKEHRVSFRADATCGRIDVNEANRLRGAEIRCIKVDSPGQRRRPERTPGRSAPRRLRSFGTRKSVIPQHTANGSSFAWRSGARKEFEIKDASSGRGGRRPN
jgi:hypothetical protein